VLTMFLDKCASYTTATLEQLEQLNKSSAVAEMGDPSHNRHGPKTGGGAAVPLSRGSWVPV